MITLEDCIKEHQKLFVCSENLNKMEEFSDKEKYFLEEEKEVIHKNVLLLNRIVRGIESSMQKTNLEEFKTIQEIYDTEIVVFENVKKFEKAYYNMLSRKGCLIKMNGAYIDSIEKIED